MSLNCGIVGLPNVGKSTIFQAMTSAPAEAANYPFCTIEPNVGVVALQDLRLDKLTEIFEPKKKIPTVVEFVDIAGLVKGASKGEGLGNQFLGHIRQVNAIVHVVRCFDDPDIVHVSGRIDPIDDIEIINMELALADLETVEKRLSSNVRNLKSQNKEIHTKAAIAQPVLERLQKHLAEGVSARQLGLDEEEIEAISDLHLITLKPVLYACNVDESCLEEENDYVKQVREYAAKEDNEVVVICGKLESEIAALETEAERREFMDTMGIEESGLARLIHAGYNILGLRTFFTAGSDECRAWTFKNGDKAPQAAGVIHSDFERGFIKAEVYSYDDIVEFGTETKVKEAGKFRIEGKDYVVQDGDIMHFRFNV